MAYGTVSLTNGIEVKTAPVGYSWTMFFFGCFPPFFRQDWMWGICLLIAGIFTWGLAGFVASFFYNKVYIKNLINKGFKVNGMIGVTEDGLKAYTGLINIPKA
jgi:hypothetical protein